VASTVEQIVNQALLECGRTKRIADIYEGGDAAVAVELYGQARDELLRDHDWDFTRRVAALTLLKGPPPAGGYNPLQPWSTAYPPPGYLYEYAYPTDCVTLRAIIAPPGPMPDLDPLPALWRIDNDSSLNPNQKVILCNVTNAMAVYRGQVNDPGKFTPNFTQALVARLVDRFSKAFDKEINKEKDAEQDNTVTTAVESQVRG
jgi:hypothetical protein